MEKAYYNLKMTRCSICNVEGHRSPHCNGVFITEWTEKLKRYWIFGHHNSVENDEEVKLWARNYRFTKPIINRLFDCLRKCMRENRWVRINITDREQYTEMRFILNTPTTILRTRVRIEDYVRPTELQIDINAIIAAQDNERAERNRIRLVQQQERLVEVQRAREVERQRIAADPNILVRRNLQREFDRANVIMRRAQAHVQQAFTPRSNPSLIQIHMDTTEQAYFVNDDCPICMEQQTPDNTIAVDCGHTFCVTCLKQTMQGGGVQHCCPSCRNPITKLRFKPTITPDNFNIISTHVLNLI